MILGSKVLITDILKIASSVTISTAKITITDPNGSTKVNAQDMTEEVANKIYSYKWQSSTSDTEGNYKAVITYTTSDSDVDVVKKEFRLNTQDNE